MCNQNYSCGYRAACVVSVSVLLRYHHDTTLALVRVLDVIDSLNLGWNVEQLFSGTEAADFFQLVLAVWAGKIIQTMMKLLAR